MEEREKNTMEITPDELPEEEQLVYYREAYLRERKKAAALAGASRMQTRRWRICRGNFHGSRGAASGNFRSHSEAFIIL